MGIGRYLPGRAKSALRSWRHHARGAIIRRFYAFDGKDLTGALRELGIAPGDTVMAHTAFAQFEGFRGGVSDAIQAMMAAVGEDGALMMPTMPFAGSACEYALSGKITDVKKSPSCMGLLTEVFRRRAGVIRSIHPTHPIAVWSRKAAELADGHHTAATPCGERSPFHRLVQADGKVLLAGVDIAAMSFFHYIEERIEPKMPFSPFTTEWFDLQTRGANGQLYPTRTRLYDPAVSSRRSVGKLIDELRAMGGWRETKAGRLTLAVVRAANALEAAERMAARGEYCYRAPADERKNAAAR